MFYNLICGLWFVCTVVLSKLLEKCKKKELILRILSIVLFVYKTVHYLCKNIKGNVSIPVEISSVSYFLSFVILMFKLKKLYCVGAFFGIAAGVGYFLFYTLFGFTLTHEFTVKNILIGCFSHGYLLISGIYLFRNHKFKKTDKTYIWITILAMLCWAFAFYDFEMRGITFIYYVIKPKFLFVSISAPINALSLISYYSVLVILFSLIINLFFKLKRCYRKSVLIKEYKKRRGERN